jgi:hypothetical protein
MQHYIKIFALLAIACSSLPNMAMDWTPEKNGDKHEEKLHRLVHWPASNPDSEGFITGEEFVRELVTPGTQGTPNPSQGSYLTPDQLIEVAHACGFPSTDEYLSARKIASRDAVELWDQIAGMYASEHVSQPSQSGLGSSDPKLDWINVDMPQHKPSPTPQTSLLEAIQKQCPDIDVYRYNPIFGCSIADHLAMFDSPDNPLSLAERTAFMKSLGEQ